MSNTDSPDGPIELTTSDIERMFAEDAEDIKDTPEEKEDTKEDETELPKEEQEEELEPEIQEAIADIDDEDEPKIDEDEVVDIPRRKEILAKYPDLFKDFKFLERAFYKVSEYDNIFPSLDDAKATVIQALTLKRIEQDINTGNLDNLFKGIKQTDADGWNRCMDNLLKAVHTVDSQAYGTILRNVMSNVINGLEADGKEYDNESLKSTAKVLKDVFFGNKTPEQVKLGKEIKTDPEAEKLNRERQGYEQQRYDNSLQEVTEGIQASLKSWIDQAIDPKGSMSPYVKRNATKDALEFLENDLRNSKSLQPITQRLWQNARTNNYSRESLNKIVNAFKGRAKTLLPSAIKKARAEAMKDSRVNKGPEKTEIKSGRVAAPVKSDRTSGKKDPMLRPDGSRMTTEEYFNS